MILVARRVREKKRKNNQRVKTICLEFCFTDRNLLLELKTKKLIQLR